MAACHIEPKDIKALVGAVGQELVRRHGKKKYYKPDEIRGAAVSQGYAEDVHCWAMCCFATPGDFALVHAASGEVCDYAAMKASLLTDLAAGGTFSWGDLDLSWLEWPDIDLSLLLSGFDFSP